MTAVGREAAGGPQAGGGRPADKGSNEVRNQVAPPARSQRRLRALVLALLGRALSVLPRPASAMYAGPGLHLHWRLGWLKGWLVRPLWRAQALLGGTRVEVGRRFSLQGKLTLSGPGRVVFGDDVVVAAHTTPFTHAREACIRIGNRAFVNGTRFGCVRAIEVGDDAILADARVMDTDFHPLSRRRAATRDLPVGTAPVRIGRNVWVAAGALVLKGVSIGDNSVVAAGAVVVRDIPVDTIAGGNPARPLGPVPE